MKKLVMLVFVFFFSVIFVSGYLSGNCTIRESNCVAGETPILALSNATNAHAHVTLDPMSSPYDWKVCCPGTGIELNITSFPVNSNPLCNLRGPCWILRAYNGSGIDDFNTHIGRFYGPNGENYTTCLSISNEESYIISAQLTSCNGIGQFCLFSYEGIGINVPFGGNLVNVTDTNAHVGPCSGTGVFKHKLCAKVGDICEYVSFSEGHCFMDSECEDLSLGECDIEIPDGTTWEDIDDVCLCKYPDSEGFGYRRVVYGEECTGMNEQGIGTRDDTIYYYNASDVLLSTETKQTACYGFVEQEPGFGLISVILMSVVLIGYYYINERFKYKRGNK